MTKVRKLALLATLAAAAIIQPAVANGGAGAAAAIILNNQRAVQAAQIPLPPGHNDGFVEVDAFYREGPAFRVCPDRTGARVRLRGGQCQIRTRVRNGFLDWRYHFEYVPPIGMQAYLDEKFGEGVTEFAGVSSREVAHASSLVIFYRIRDKTSLVPH